MFSIRHLTQAEKLKKKMKKKSIRFGFGYSFISKRIATNWYLTVFVTMSNKKKLLYKLFNFSVDIDEFQTIFFCFCLLKDWMELNSIWVDKMNNFEIVRSFVKLQNFRRVWKFIIQMLYLFTYLDKTAMCLTIETDENRCTELHSNLAEIFNFQLFKGEICRLNKKKKRQMRGRGWENMQRTKERQKDEGKKAFHETFLEQSFVCFHWLHQKRIKFYLKVHCLKHRYEKHKNWKNGGKKRKENGKNSNDETIAWEKSLAFNFKHSH